MMKRIAIMASGNGTNAQRIIEYFTSNPSVRVDLVLSNCPNAFVLERANRLNVPVISFNRTDLYQSSTVLDVLSVQGIDWIILAGFLWLIPDNLLSFYKNRIINIHPALLPKYGGKGMYGTKVHEAVIRNKEKESGITIHFVNEKYDEGQVIFQTSCPVYYNDTVETLATRIHELEYRWFPEVIEKVISTNP